MKYSRVYLDAIGYELAPVVVTTAELEHRAPLLGPGSVTRRIVVV